MLENRICNGITLRDCELRNCHVTNCDLNDCKIVGGFYCSTRMKDIEIINVKHCVSCVLDDSDCKESTFANCQLREAETNRCHMLDCTVTDSLIKHTEAQRTRFSKCEIKHSQLQAGCSKHECDD